MHSNDLSFPEACVAFFLGNSTLSSANDFLLCHKADFLLPFALHLFTTDGALCSFGS